MEAFSTLNHLRRLYNIGIEGEAQPGEISTDGEELLARKTTFFEKDDLTEDLIRAKLTLAEIQEENLKVKKELLAMQERDKEMTASLEIMALRLMEAENEKVPSIA